MCDVVESVFVGYQHETRRMGLLILKPKYLSLPESVVHSNSYLAGKIESILQEFKLASGEFGGAFFLDFEEAIDRKENALQLVKLCDFRKVQSLSSSANLTRDVFAACYSGSWGVAFTKASSAMEYIQGRAIHLRMHVSKLPGTLLYSIFYC